MSILQNLIFEAQELGGGDTCLAGHTFEPIGGRACPTGHWNCSQTVYRCTKCGEHDYGYKGGVSYAECVDNCGSTLDKWKMFFPEHMLDEVEAEVEVEVEI